MNKEQQIKLNEVFDNILIELSAKEDISLSTFKTLIRVFNYLNNIRSL